MWAVGCGLWAVVFGEKAERQNFTGLFTRSERSESKAGGLKRRFVRTLLFVVTGEEQSNCSERKNKARSSVTFLIFVGLPASRQPPRHRIFLLSLSKSESSDGSQHWKLLLRASDVALRT
jgi:hypothetical protein